MQRTAASKRTAHFVARIAGVSWLVLAGSAAAALGTAIEYYHAGLNHYFLTASPQEAAGLDAGAYGGAWKRTGGQFTVSLDPEAGLAPVCRFFAVLTPTTSTHFYTADAAECALVKTYAAWTYEGIAFYIRTPDNQDCGADAPVYRSFYSDRVADANHRFTVDLTAHVRMVERRGDALEGIVMCAPVTDAEREADIVRLLEQATLGPTEAAILEVKAKGIPAWLDQQLGMNVTRYTQLPPWDAPADPSQCVDDRTLPATPEKYCFLFHFTPSPVAWEFFRQSNTAPDQLRLRMAHVWHQIFVYTGPTYTYGVADFQQRLRDNVFGTFENLLTRYSLSPQLGYFQNWVRNVPEFNGIKPNENFARELMQLFTIGVNRLNDDGTPVLDGAGQPIPTYGQSDIETLARILTGYANPPHPATPSTFGNPTYYIGDMVPFEPQHDKGAKNALNGLIHFPAGGSASAEVLGLIHALVNHPNTPPFIAKQLIQKTVTSSPTPGYVARVAAVFKDNGFSVRGDLAAVTKAILLDPEARGARKIDLEYGRLREPALMWTAMIRALDVTTDGFMPWNSGLASGQFLFSAPSVFNYYPSDYTLAGSTIPAPEFGIYGTAEFLTRANLVHRLLYHSDDPNWENPALGWAAQGYVPNATGTPSPTLAAFLSNAADANALADRLNRLLLHGTMTAAARKTIVNAVNKLPVSDSPHRTKLAVDLVLVSIDYQVQK